MSQTNSSKTPASPPQLMRAWRSCSKRAVAAAAAIVLALTATAPALVAQEATSKPQPAPAKASTFSEAQKDEIGSIVKDYLLKNPEIFLEIQSALEAKMEQVQAERLKAALAANADSLFRDPDAPVAGNPKGDVTVVEFFDYNCGVCKSGFADMAKMIEEDGNIRFVLKEFPILGRGSQEAAQVAIALNITAPEKYMDFHKKMFALRGGANAERALAVAQELGVDMAKLQANLEHQEVRATVEEVYTLANGLGLTGTPSYIIGNEVFGGLIGYERMKQAVASTRQCGEATC